MTEAAGHIAFVANTQTPAEACLRPILGALGWTGEIRRLHEVLPSDATLPDIESLLEALEKLNFQAIRLSRKSGAIGADALPALVAKPDGDIWAIIGGDSPERLEVFKGRASQIETMPLARVEGDYYFIRPGNEDAEQSLQGRFGWMSGLLRQERNNIAFLFAVALLINLLSLTLPFYLMAVFDLAIGAYSTQTLAALSVGIGIVIVAEMALRETRARALASLAVRTQATVMAAVFDKLLRLPIGYVESAPLTAQLNRLKLFESVREIFSGPLAAALLDLPFVVIFVIAVFVVSASMGWVVIGFMAAIAALVAISIPLARARNIEAGRRRAETRLFRQDTALHHLVIRETAACDVWLKRYRDLIARQLSATQAAQKISFNEQTIAQALTFIAGALIVGLGGVQVMSGELSAGALVALMAIVWRILTPIQTAFLSLNKLFQALDTAAQVNQLMRLPQESRSGAINRFFRRIRGEIRLENVGFRYPAQASPALRGIDASIAAGEFVVVTGAQDAGRSTLLKLLANLYQPSFGRILIDGSDASQFDIRELRCAIALVNDEQTIFADTLAQNLAFANPPATREQMARAVRDADLASFVEQLEDGLDADLSDLLAHGLSGVVKQKIRLARAYLGAPKIYLLDDPLNDLDESGRLALLAKLRSLKREATIIVTEPDAEILKLADRAIGMKAGQLVPPVIAGKLAPPRRAPHPAPASAERLPANSTTAEYSKGSSS